MKILLMNSPDLNVGKTTSDWDLDASDIGVFPPVGIMYLASALRGKTSHDVKLLDCILESLNLDEIIERIKEYNPDILGLTAYTPTLYDTISVCRKIRQTLPDIKIVWGGPHTMLFPEESMEHDCVDYLVTGEAEETFPRFCDALDAGKSIDDITGVYYRAGGKVCNTGAPSYVQNIDELKFPAFDMLDYKSYYSAIGTGQTVGTICSSRGCPFQCTFCCKPYSTYRSRSIENIMEEMSKYYDNGVREFFFFDDLFNLTPERVQNISQAIIDKKWKIIWAFRGRVDAVTPDMLRLARRSGCRQILYGVEDATDEGLKQIKKKITVKKVRDAVIMTRKAGILSSTNWIIGFPHHKTEDDITNLLKTAIEIDSDYAQFNICIAYHGTEIFNQGVERGIYAADIWRDYARKPVPSFKEPIWEEHLSREKLSGLLKMCYQKFYFRVVPIARKLFGIRSWSEFKLYIKGALIVLGFGGYHRDEEKK